MEAVGNLDTIKLHYCLLLLTIRFEKVPGNKQSFNIGLYLDQTGRLVCLLLVLSGACNLV